MEVTQEVVDKGFMDAKRRWREIVMESGEDVETLILSSPEAVEFLYDYSVVQVKVRKMGFKMPDIVKGLTVKERRV